MTNKATKTVQIRSKADGRQSGKTTKAKTAKTTASAKPTNVKTHVTRVSKYPYKTDAMAGLCTCGCGDKTKGGMFIQGHDAKLKSLLLSISRKEDGFGVKLIKPVTVLRQDQIGFLKTMPELAKIVDAAS